MKLNQLPVVSVIGLLVVLSLVAGLRGADEAATDDAGVRDLVDRYFKSWSAADMEAYEACFHPQARISFLDTAGVVNSIDLPEFVETQKKAHQQSKWPMTSSPTDVAISGDRLVMHVRAKWLLKIDRREVRSVDYLTLARQEKEWRIIALVFHGQ